MNKTSDKNTKLTFGTLGYLDISLKREIYEDLSAAYTGTFKIKNTVSNDLTTYTLKIPYKTTEIVLTESDTKPLTVKIKLLTKTNYELSIYHEDFISKFLKLFGVKEIEIGNKSFDKKYWIKSNDSGLTKKILKEDLINQMLTADFYSMIYKSKKESSELTTVVSRIVDLKTNYCNLIDLHQKLIDRLTYLRITTAGNNKQTQLHE